ncbi:MAG: maleylpyruvate isomerase family mycothiol-dependent enzyme, partial [Actinomycetota bacterium]|nr:maleylpyruvate isomerase family mycothiol-dependent enzyme [Actinomycetota bacterium]
HEHDIRLPLASAGARDEPAIELAVDGYVRWLGRRLRERELPSIAVAAEDGAWVAGKTEPAVTVEAPSKFDLLRALTGRRTRDEIAAFEWSDDPEPYLDVFSMYGMPAASLGE